MAQAQIFAIKDLKITFMEGLGLSLAALENLRQYVQQSELTS